MFSTIVRIIININFNMWLYIKINYAKNRILATKLQPYIYTHNYEITVYPLHAAFPAPM